MTNNAAYWIDHLNLLPHPEGGFYKETYRSPAIIPGNIIEGFESARNVSTSIYFLLPSGKISAFHKIRSDELWFFHAGTSLLIHILDKEHGLQTCRLGLNVERGDQLQVVVPAFCWFGSEVEDQNSYSLVSCNVAPGFDFQDFEMAKRADLQAEFPRHNALIAKLTY